MMTTDKNQLERELEGSAPVAVEGWVTGRLVVRCTSITTKIKKRDERLRGDDSFASDRFPDIVFEFEQVTQKLSGPNIAGRLKVIERTVGFNFPTVVTDLGSGRMGIDAEVQIDRSELGLSYLGKAMSTN